MEPQTAEIVMSALLKIAQAAPGFIEAFSGHESTEEALAAAEKALDAVPMSPARAAIDKRKQEMRLTFVRIMRAHEASLAFVTIPVEGGEATIKMDDAKRHLKSLITSM